MTNWLRVSQSKPCPVCGKPDWCGVFADGSAVCCMRTESDKQLANGGWLHRMNGDSLGQGDIARPQQCKPRTFKTAQDAVEWVERKRGKRVADWTYHDGDGELVGMVLRWVQPDGKKKILPVSKHGEGWQVLGMPTPRPLYRLPELSSAEVVFITEGEKAADSLAGLGFVVTTSAHGSKGAKETDWAPLAGKACIILPDNDAPGRAYRDKVVGLLEKLSPAPTVKVVTLPGLPKAGDAVDYVAMRRKAGAADDAIRVEIEELAEAAEEVKPEPKPTSAIPKWRPFPTKALPEPLRSLVTSVAVAVGCDRAFVALPALAMLASCIGNTRRIRLNGTWTQPAIIWTGVVAESGDMKSPAFKPVLKPLWETHRRLHDEYAEAIERYDASVEEWNAHSKAKGAVAPAKPKPPVAERVIVGDITIEALAPILLENWRGVLLHQDELQELFGSFDKYRSGRGSDCAKWNSIHNGEPIVIDRKTGIPRTVYVPKPCVSISGTIQPATLARVLTNEYKENGLAARFLFARPPRRIQQWTDAEVPEAVTSAFEDIIDGLRGLAPGEDKAGHPVPKSLRLTPDARDLFIAFVNRHGEEQFSITGPLAAAYSKLKGYAARFALVFQCVRGVAGKASMDMVDAESIAAGIVLADWFKGEAERIYAGFSETAEDAENRQVVDWIRAKGGSVTVRDLTRGPVKFRGKPEAAKAALVALVDANLGRWIESGPSKHGGRPSRRFQLCDAATSDETPGDESTVRGFVTVAAVTTPNEREHWPEGRPQWVDPIMGRTEVKVAESPDGSPGYNAHLSRIQRPATERSASEPF